MSFPQNILGIDPGLDGALALYGPGGLLELWDMPVLELQKRRVIDEYALARLIDDRRCEIAEAWLELVGSRPGEGHAGAFAFGRGYGVLRGVLAANFLPIVDVTPARWKAAMKVHGEKDASRYAATLLMPRAAHHWPLKKHHGRAEATLIAVHGFRNSKRLGGN